MVRVDLLETIGRIDFPKEVWEWLDFFGEIVVFTQQEASYQDDRFIPDNPFKTYFLYNINKDISTLNAIYILLRCEIIHQATSHVRLFCESLITLKYISLDPDVRSNLFWNYNDIEAYKIASSILEWEGFKANPQHVKRLEAFRDSIQERYEKAKETYTIMDKNGRKKPFINWCNKSIAAQARECGPNFHRLYDLVYRQMSSYIHGSSWSLRRQISYSAKHYQPNIVLNDVAQIIRISLVVWIEWANFCIDNFHWRLAKSLIEIPKRIVELESKHFS